MKWSDLAGKLRLLDTQSLLAELLVSETIAAHTIPEILPAGRFVSVDGVDLHYIERGVGRPVVFLHGAGGMLDEVLSSPVAALLAQRYRLIVFDRPGFGHSTRPRADLAGPGAQARLLRAALGKLGIERPIIVGHSWGGAMALAYAIEFPEALSSLVLLAGWAYPARQAAIMLFSLPSTPFLGGLVQRSVWPSLARLLAPEAVTRIFAPAIVPAAFLDSFPLEMALRPSQLFADAEDMCMLNPGVARLQQHYSKLSMPIELVTGDSDSVVHPEQHAMRLAALLPHSRLTVLGGVGHMPHHSAPEEVLHAVDRAAV
ncbi:MAG TPA: alpha/beta hydrolase [Aliidongia sp.]|nr:alpha/beta hydrolase [Aliidongia sp.]